VSHYCERTRRRSNQLDPQRKAILPLNGNRLLRKSWLTWCRQQPRFYALRPEVLLERCHFLLGDQSFADFMAAVDHPPNTNKELARLLTGTAPWE
jgi:hypothetical protein